MDILLGARRGAHLPFQAIEPVGGYTTESVTHDQCDDARPTVTFPATEHYTAAFGQYQVTLLGNKGTCV